YGFSRVIRRHEPLARILGSAEEPGTGSGVETTLRPEDPAARSRTRSPDDFTITRSLMYVPRQQRMLDQYLQEIGQIPLLKPEEEVDLAQRIKQGEAEALHKLVRANLRFVVSVATKYQGQGLTLSDLINEGNYGLRKA